LEKDVKKRLGYGKEDAEGVKAHSFFKGVNWDDVYKKKLHLL